MLFSRYPRSRIAVPLVLTAVFTAAPALGQLDQALSLDESLQIAIARSSQIIATDAQVRASREMAVSAEQLPGPVPKFGVNNVPVDGADRFNLTNDFMTMRSVGVMQEFTREEKRKARAERFEREAEIGAAQRDWNLTTVKRDTALASLDRSYQESMRTLLALSSPDAMDCMPCARCYAAPRSVVEQFSGDGHEPKAPAWRPHVAQLADLEKSFEASGQRVPLPLRIVYGRWRN